GPAEALLGLDITASQLRDQDVCQIVAVVTGYERDGAAPGAAGHLGVGVSDEPIADATRVLGLPAAPVADLRQVCSAWASSCGTDESSAAASRGTVSSAGRRVSAQVSMSR